VSLSYYVLAGIAGLAVTILFLDLLDPAKNATTYEAPMTVSQKLTELTAAVNNVTATVQAQSAQIVDLKAQIQAAQADKAQAEADVATIQAQIDALNALAVPVAPPAQ
jgi:peptidoglycan hydrolase CwlO-like protein